MAKTKIPATTRIMLHIGMTAITRSAYSSPKLAAKLAQAGATQLLTLSLHRRVPEICGSRTGDCLRVLLKRVQDGTLANEPDVFADAAERWMKRRSI